MMLTDQIKLQTRVQHQELEAVLIPKIKSIRSMEDYAKVLHIFFGYFDPLEKAVAVHTDHRLPDFDQKRKTGTILKDLDCIENEGNFPIREFAIPEIQNFHQALGALYVMEGSTLGGRVIANMIGRQLNMQAETGLAFFNGYGEGTGVMWDKFQRIINDSNFSEFERQAVIITAKITFIHFTSLVKQHYGM